MRIFHISEKTKNTSPLFARRSTALVPSVRSAYMVESSRIQTLTRSTPPTFLCFLAFLLIDYWFP
jgi:hypothetical protein